MTREEIIEIISEKLKLIRVEADYTQDKLAEVVGVSKKTLVQIEKGRNLASWPVVVAICALFRESSVIQGVLGGDPLEVIETVARDGVDFRKEKTLGGRVWWKEISRQNGFVLQQNVLSQHFRILDKDNFRIYSTFDKTEASTRYKELLK